MSDSYDLKSVKLPKLGGAALHLMVTALEGPLKGPLVGSLLKNAGVHAFRNVCVDEDPTERPRFPHGTAEAVSPRVELPEQPPEIPGERPPSVRDFAEAYRAGRIDPGEVARRILEAVDTDESGAEPLRAFVSIDRDDVLRQAEDSTRRFRSGTPLGPLDGVPVAVKDEVDMQPYPTTVGTSFLGRSPAAADNMHEIGIAPTGFNPHYGQVRNPYNPGHDTGGSSSGSAAAVAAGFCPLAVGADGGGSIRIPAAFCGLVGLKPTYGRVSEAGAAPLCWSVAHLGPLAATVEDAALGYAVMAGPDPRDPGSINQPAVVSPDPGRTDLTGLTVGVFRPWFEHAENSVVEACDAALGLLEAAGARLRSIDIPGLDALRVAHAVTILSEMAAAMAPYFNEHRRHFGLDSRLLLAMARSLTATDYVLAQRVRTAGIRTFLKFLEQVDVVATPAAAVTAPPVPADTVKGESDTTTVVEVMRFAFAGNLTGLPAVVVPAGYDPGGLPIGGRSLIRVWPGYGSVPT